MTGKDIESKDKNKERRIQGIDRPTEDIQGKEKNKDTRTKGIDRPKKGSQVKEKNKERRFEGTDKPKAYSVGNENRKGRHAEGIDKPKEGIVGKDYTREKPINGIDRHKEGTLVNDYNKERQIEGIDRPKEEILGKGNWKERQTEGISGPKMMGKGDIRKRKSDEIDGLRTIGDAYKEGQIVWIEGPKCEVERKDKIRGKEAVIQGVEKHKHEERDGTGGKSNDMSRDKEKEGKVHKGIDHKQIEQKVLLMKNCTFFFLPDSDDGYLAVSSSQLNRVEWDAGDDTRFSHRVLTLMKQVLPLRVCLSSYGFPRSGVIMEPLPKIPGFRP